MSCVDFLNSSVNRTISGVISYLMLLLLSCMDHLHFDTQPILEPTQPGHPSGRWVLGMALSMAKYATFSVFL